MKSKKLIVVSIAMALVLMLTLAVGCGQPSPTTPTPTEQAPQPPEQTIKLTGAKTDFITLDYFKKGASCHGTPLEFIEQDGKTSVYTGIPLWLMCGWVDDDISHGFAGFNDKLAEKGYRVVVIAADGHTATFDSKEIARNNNIILANKVGIEFIEGYPTLVSSEPGRSLKLENVVEVRLEFE